MLYKDDELEIKDELMIKSPPLIIFFCTCVDNILTVTARLWFKVPQGKMG